MFVVYESPLQMLSDSPSAYLREPEVMDFLSRVPTVWDETRVIVAEVGRYAVVARRLGKEWYIGAMTNWDGREIELDLSFLGPGDYRAEVYSDGVNAAKYAADYERTKAALRAVDKLTIRLAPGGGWAARLFPPYDRSQLEQGINSVIPDQRVRRRHERRGEPTAATSTNGRWNRASVR
jgi:alpha-glucosidase